MYLLDETLQFDADAALARRHKKKWAFLSLQIVWAFLSLQIVCRPVGQYVLYTL